MAKVCPALSEDSHGGNPSFAPFFSFACFVQACLQMGSGELIGRRYLGNKNLS